MTRTTILLEDAPLPEDLLGLPMRIVGLAKAKDLNGSVGFVRKYVAERERYEVELVEELQVPEHSMKSIQAVNLEPLPVAEEVKLWQGMVEKSGGGCVSALERLEKLVTNVQLLLDTKVGRTVNDFAKRCPSAPGAMLARKLVARWKQDFKETKAKLEAKEVPVAPAPRVPEVKVEEKSERPRKQEEEKLKREATVIPAMQGPEDAKKMLERMRVANDSSRLALLLAIDSSPKHCMRSLVQFGGLEVLVKWLRKSQDARHACLLTLQKLPVTLEDLRRAECVATVQAIAGQDSVEQHRVEAKKCLDRWRAAGFFPKRKEPPAVEPVAKQPRAEPRAEPRGDQPRAQPRTPPLETLPAAEANEIPEALRGLDPRIVHVLNERPQLLKFLQKHPNVLYKNLNSDALAFLHRNLQNSQRTRQEQDVTMGCTVTVSGLHGETKEEDVRQRFHDIELEPLKVTLPRESRRQKSCGMSFVMLKSVAEAQAAVHQLNGTLIHEQPITVAFLMTENPKRKPAPRVKWAKDSELWEAPNISS